LFGCYWQYSLTEVDKKFELKLSKSQICLYCKMKNKENRFQRKKVKKRSYLITTHKSKVLGIFDDKKSKEYQYRLQSIFSIPTQKYLCLTKSLVLNQILKHINELKFAKFKKEVKIMLPSKYSLSTE